MAVIPIKYSISENAYHVWSLIHELGNTDTVVISSSIDKLGNLHVWNEIIEDPSLNNKYKYSRDGRIHAYQFYEGYPSVPIYESGSISNITFDDMNSYSDESLLDGLNSGSNEWNNITPYAAYFSRTSFFGIIDWDDMNDYISGSSLTSSLVGLGRGIWKNQSYLWYGRQAYYYSYVLEIFNYNTGSNLNNIVGGINAELYISWSLPWIVKQQTLYGIKAYENFTEYVTGSELNGQDGISDTRWDYFSGSWRVVNL